MSDFGGERCAEVKTASRRGRATPASAHEIPALPEGSSPPAASLRGGLLASSLRARVATTRHMAFLHACALRYDDSLEGQLGDTLHFSLSQPNPI